MLIYDKPLFVPFMAEENLVDSDDPLVQMLRQVVIMQKALFVTDALEALGIPSEEASIVSTDLLNLEKSYLAYCDPNDKKYLEYGVYADSFVCYTPEELSELSPDFPVTGIIARFGKDKSQDFVLQFPEWLKALNDLWTEDNLELLKQMTQVKILIECQNYIDPDIFQVARAALEEPEPEPQDRAYEACASLDTFSQVIAQTYVEECLGQEAVDRLTTMAQNLIDTYKTLITDTSWLGAESRQKVLDKLNYIKLNILYPEGGYFNYDDLRNMILPGFLSRYPTFL